MAEPNVALSPASATTAPFQVEPALKKIAAEAPSIAIEVPGRLLQPRISVVIPALNEAQNLPHVLCRLPECVSEVILVDGGSSDGTVEAFKELLPEAIVVHQTGRGKGNALAVGFMAATGDIVVMLDCDGSADPNEIPKFVEVLTSGADFAKGTRFGHGGSSADITRFRGLGNAVLVRLVNLLYRTDYTDLCYGMNAFWRHCLPHMHPDCDGFEVETLINIRIARAGLKVQEVGSHEARRLYGFSKLHTIRDGWRVLRTIIAEFRPRSGDLGAVAGAQRND